MHGLRARDYEFALGLWMFVLLVVAAYEWWFVSHTTAIFTRFPNIVGGRDIAIEIVAPAFVSAITWWVAARRFKIAFMPIFLVGVLMCVGVLVVLAPGVAAGAATALLHRSASLTPHLPGVHTNPVPRHVAFAIVSSAAGVWFVLKSMRTRREPSST